MSGHELGPRRTAKRIAVLHLTAASVLLLGPFATTRALARLPRLPALPFPLETGRDGAAFLLLVALLWIGGGAWIRRLAGDSRVGFPEALKAGVLAVACSLATAVTVVSGGLLLCPLWAFGAWAAALGVRIGRGRPAYQQSLAMQRLMLVLGLFLVWWGFGALLAVGQAEVPMAATLCVMAIILGVLLLVVAAPMLHLLRTAAVRSALSFEVNRLR